MEKEVIVELLKTNPEIAQEALVVLKETEIGKEFLNNYKEVVKSELKPTLESEIHANVRKEVYGSLETDMFNILGRKVEPTEKTYDVFKTTLAELAELKKNKQTPSNDAKIQDAENKINELAQLLEKERQEKVNLENEFKQRELDAKKEHEINKWMRGLKFKSDIPQELIDNYIATLKNELKGALSFDDNGNAILLDSNGQRLRDDVNFKEIVPKDYFKKKLFNYLETDAPQGSKAPMNTSASEVSISEDSVEIILKSNDVIKSQMDAYEHFTKLLNEYGITRTDKRFEPAITKAIRDYNVQALPFR